MLYCLPGGVNFRKASLPMSSYRARNSNPRTNEHKAANLITDAGHIRVSLQSETSLVLVLSALE